MNTVKSRIYQIIIHKESLLLLILFIAGLSILGWIIGEVTLASVSPAYIPIAPSTAIIFIILGSCLFVRNIKNKSPVIQLLNSALVLLLILYCLNIFLGYLFDLTWVIENFYIQNPKTLGSVPIGRMSPITALLFIFISIGILSNRQNANNTIRYIGGSFSLMASVISSVLLIGYLYKAPLLYGSKIIPVALPTAICFMLFSITLLRLYDLNLLNNRRIKENNVTLLLIKSFFPIVVFIVILQGFLDATFSFNDINPALSSIIVLLIVLTITAVVVIRTSHTIGIKLLASEKKLKESEIEFRSLAESMPQIVWTTRADGWNTYFNQQWVDYTGLTLVESYGHGWNTPFHPEDKQRAWDAWQNAVNNYAEYSIDCRLKCHDGSYHWWLIRGVPQLSAGGEIIKFYGTCTDIEKIKEAEEALKESEKQLLRLNADKDRFISILGHDLKSPFNNILGLSEILIEDIRSLNADEIEVIARNINKSAINTNKLLEDILTWARTKQGSLDFQPRIHSLSITCRNVLEIMNPAAFAKNITIQNSSLENIDVYADADMIKTVLLNLVSNAIKFTKSGGKISISAEQNSENVTISVSDNGVGIPSHNLSKLFSISDVLSTKGTAGETGTGLGLLLCKEFIEKHGGKIWFASEAGKGSDFKFTLPVYKDQTP